LNAPLYLLTIYKKNEKIDLRPKDRETISRLIDELINLHAEQNYLRLINEKTSAKGA
jgi:hypothetical protein